MDAKRAEENTAAPPEKTKRNIPDLKMVIFALVLAAVLIASIYVIAAFIAGRGVKSPVTEVSHGEAGAQQLAQNGGQAAVNVNLAPPTMPPASATRNVNSPIQSSLSNMVWSGAVYVMISQDNKIRVYSADMSTLYDQIDTYVSMLPLADQQMLAAGISITSQDQLNQLIEAYSE